MQTDSEAAGLCLDRNDVSSHASSQDELNRLQQEKQVRYCGIQAVSKLIAV